MSRNNSKISSIICGLLFLAAGVMLFAFNAGLLPMVFKRIVFSWQMFLIALGFVFLFSRRNFIGGVVLIMVGGFFLLPKLTFWGLPFVPQSGWAFILIVVGLLVLFGRDLGNRQWISVDTEMKRRPKRRSYRCGNHEHESGYIEMNRVFSGSKERIDFKNFKGGEINGVFGGIELDLSDAQLAEGTNYLELNSVFGGVVLIVPIEWKIELRQTQVFGSFEDNRPKPGFEVDENRVLIIEANAVFGGGEIKCR